MWDDLWATSVAHVMCRQLDCGEGIGALGNGRFGEGVGSILLDDVQCRGNEAMLGTRACLSTTVTTVRMPGSLAQGLTLLTFS